MIKVKLYDILMYGLPLDNYSKVMMRGCSRKVLKELEKKYSYKTNDVCLKTGLSQHNVMIYENVIYHDIDEKDKDKWVVNYEVYMRSSFVYKFWIFVRKVNRKFR